MSIEKISPAIGCLSDKKIEGVLPLNEFIEGKTVLSILNEKHSPAKTANTNYITEVKTQCHTTPLFSNKLTPNHFENQP